MTDRRECDCGPDDICSDCTSPEELAAGIRAFILAEIREGEVPDAG